MKMFGNFLLCQPCLDSSAVRTLIYEMENILRVSIQLCKHESGSLGERKIARGDTSPHGECFQRNFDFSQTLSVSVIQ